MTSLEKGPKMERSGYCAVRSRVRFSRFLTLPLIDTLDLDDFDDLLLHLRGDGRTYIVTIQTDGLVPDDVFQAFLYTRPDGGWETVRVRGGSSFFHETVAWSALTRLTV